MEYEPKQSLITIFYGESFTGKTSSFNAILSKIMKELLKENKTIEVSTQYFYKDSVYDLLTEKKPKKLKGIEEKSLRR